MTAPSVWSIDTPRMSDTSHCDLTVVLPYAERVFVSPPLITVWRAHGSTFFLCSD